MVICVSWWWFIPWVPRIRQQKSPNKTLEPKKITRTDPWIQGDEKTKLGNSNHFSGQINIVPKPELRWMFRGFWWDSLTFHHHLRWPRRVGRYNLPRIFSGSSLFQPLVFEGCTLLGTLNSSPLKIDLWKMRFRLETTIFTGNVSFREGILIGEHDRILISRR